MINKSSQQLENKLVNDIEDLKRQLRDIKNVQLIGADILTVQSVPPLGPLSAGPVTVAAGLSRGIDIIIDPGNETLTLWNFLATIYVDVHDQTHQFSGSSNTLTDEQKKLVRCDWVDWADSSDSSNMRMYKVRLWNQGISSHDYYIDFRAYLPKLAGTA